jgi:carbamate kinase
MRAVIALGGNALLRRGEPLDAAVQRANVKVAAEAVAGVARRHEVILTHGNGPQVGLLALQNEAYTTTAAYPLDVLGAETEGMVGYLLAQELGRHLPRERILTVLTQVIVDADDPAFEHPTKFVGPMYDQEEAGRLAAARGWAVAEDGDGWRRVVPSPEPRAIVELEVIRMLADRGVTVICAGGGGIPVVEDGTGGLAGVEAVIDKDLSAALLASAAGAEALVLLTDVPAVVAGWGTPEARALGACTVDELRSMTFAAGSMGPKVEAVCRFVEGGGRLGAIGALADVEEILAGTAGTQVRRGSGS